MRKNSCINGFGEASIEKENKNQLTSSGRVGMRDINDTLFAPISRIETLRDEQGRSAFTLIELLVVVLIIGVLAAIAVSQYQKAVEKSRYAKMLSIITNLAKEYQVYYMRNGEHPASLADLDITVPGLDSNGCLKDGKYGICVLYYSNYYNSTRLYVKKGNGEGRASNGYVYLPNGYRGAYKLVEPGIYCHQSQNWGGTQTPDGMCKGALVYSDAAGIFYQVNP